MQYLALPSGKDWMFPARCEVMDANQNGHENADLLRAVLTLQAANTPVLL